MCTVDDWNGALTDRNSTHSRHLSTREWRLRAQLISINFLRSSLVVRIAYRPQGTVAPTGERGRLASRRTARFGDVKPRLFRLIDR
jgi:hypothetical protein